MRHVLTEAKFTINHRINIFLAFFFERKSHPDDCSKVGKWVSLIQEWLQSGNPSGIGDDDEFRVFRKVSHTFHLAANHADHTLNTA